MTIIASRQNTFSAAGPAPDKGGRRTKLTVLVVYSFYCDIQLDFARSMRRILIICRHALQGQNYCDIRFYLDAGIQQYGDGDAKHSVVGVGVWVVRSNPARWSYERSAWW